jgi:PAS domain S-box-containing protein
MPSDDTNKKHRSLPLRSLPIIFRPQRIVIRVALISSALIIISIGLFVLATIPYQRTAILDAMTSEAKSTVTSIDQVTASAIITEDFGTVVEHCLRVVQESPSIVYVVVTRNDGFSLISTKQGWAQRTLQGIWVPPGKRVADSRFLNTDISKEEVYHYSHPFQYSGIDWGWIHIGLSLKKFNADIASMYRRTAILALLCISVGILVALLFARKLTRPISALAATTELVARGDLDARADIRTGDELENLGRSFNTMTETLQRSQGEIIAAREYTDNIIKSMNDTLMVVNADSIIERVNTATLKLLGYREEELIGSSIGKVLAPSDPAEGADARNCAISTIINSGFVSNVETTYRAGDGTLIPVIFSASVMYGTRSTVQGIVCVALDIRERKRTEVALREAKDAAEAASKAKSQFLANMSHEIRTPMNGVLGMLDLLIDSKLDSTQQRFARMAHSSAEKLLSIINDILDFSKIEAGRLDLQQNRFLLRDVLQEVIELFSVKAGIKGIALRLQVAPPVPDTVVGDSSRLRQVLINLLGNAMKFTDSGEVSLDVKLAEKTGEDVMLHFEVRDTGRGIEETKLATIFDAFSQADSSMARRHEGTGLGLAISKQLVEMMGGTIGVESLPEKGSLFWFTVRLQIQTGAAISPASTSCTAVTKHSALPPDLQILLAEDNPVNQEMCRFMLEGLGCRVDVVENGVSAVEAALTRSYDMIFMDCQMPEVDGYEATSRIRKQEATGQTGGRRIPIVALTAHAMQGDRESCMDAGMDDYLAKPFNMNELADMLYRWAGSAGGLKP